MSEKDIVIFDDNENTSTSKKPLTNEQAQQEAYDPETGEINWDCPCLGPMTQPPCGEKFKEAFSCFVYSKEEPKGSDCIEQFREMQKCFQAHPEIYGADDDDEEEEDDEEDENDVDDLKGKSDEEDKKEEASTQNVSS